MDTKILFIYIAALVVIYFFFILPKNKKLKQQQQFIADLKKGDKVVTTGGIHGKVAELKELTIVLDLGGNSKMKINRAAISMEATALENKAETSEES